MLIPRLLAQAASAPTTAPQAEGPWIFRNGGSLVPVLILVSLMYLLVFRSGKKEKKRKSMLESLKRGDRVQTIGGMLGTVVEMRENDSEVVLKVDENTNTKIRFSRSAVHRVLDDEAPPK